MAMDGLQLSGGVAEIAIGAVSLSASFESALQSVVVEQELNLPAVCSIELGGINFQTAGWQGMDLETFGLGDPIRVRLGRDNATDVFRGELAVLEPTFDDTTMLEIRGFDPLYRLGFGTNLRTFENVKDSDLAERIGMLAGLATETDDSGVLYPYILQNNQSDLELLRTRAARINYELLYDADVLNFRKSRAGQSAVVRLQYGSSLTRLSLRLQALRKGSTVQKTAWDARNKQSLMATVAQGDRSLAMGGRQTGYEASKAFAASPISEDDPEIFDADSAKVAATAAYEALLSPFIEGEGEMPGDTRVRPGVNVQLSGIAPRFEGTYYVTAAVHTYRAQDGYRTKFKVRRTGI